MKQVIPRGFRQVLDRTDLTALSVSSVGPLFSIAAAGGVMIGLAGEYVWMALIAIGLPLLSSSFIFQVLNRHFPNAGASYHWGRQVIGRRFGRFQAVVLIVAYFASIPPIVMPAAQYTWDLVRPGSSPAPGVLLGIGTAWVLFALVPLVLGAIPTARLTKIFLVVEATALVVAIGGALIHGGALHLPNAATGRPPWTNIALAAVVAATIMDGWEIDSFAAEESRSPRRDPGRSGIFGAFYAFGTYAVLFPLIMAQTPLAALAGSPDPLSAWAFRLFPQAHWIILVPILASTGGSLWLTTYVLSRVLYALGRDRLLPGVFTRMNRHHAPVWAVIVPLGLTLAVVSAELVIPSIGALFQLVLSAAGFFLTIEFLLDSVSASWFLSMLHRHQWPHGSDHRHTGLKWLSYVNSLMLLTLVGLFLVFAPRELGRGIDGVVGILILVAGGFALAPARAGDAAFYIFQPPVEKQRENSGG